MTEEDKRHWKRGLHSWPSVGRFLSRSKTGGLKEGQSSAQPEEGNGPVGQASDLQEIIPGNSLQQLELKALQWSREIPGMDRTFSVPCDHAVTIARYLKVVSAGCLQEEAAQSAFIPEVSSS